MANTFPAFTAISHQRKSNKPVNPNPFAAHVAIQVDAMGKAVWVRSDLVRAILDNADDAELALEEAEEQRDVDNENRAKQVAATPKQPAGSVVPVAAVNPLAGLSPEQIAAIPPEVVSTMMGGMVAAANPAPSGGLASAVQATKDRNATSA